MAHLRMGKTVIAVEGTLTKPTDLAALDMRLKLSGVNMARLYALTGIVLPETPPFAMEGHFGDKQVKLDRAGRLGAGRCPALLDQCRATRKQRVRPAIGRGTRQTSGAAAGQNISRQSPVG